MKFYVGLHHPGDATHFDRACVSIRRLNNRKKPICNTKILLDSGAFRELEIHGRYRSTSREYADQIKSLARVMDIEAAVAQDYMCEPFMLAKTGMSIADHQRLTIQRYDELLFENCPVTIMPVLQGYAKEDYLRHLDDYGERLKPGMWVGVGSVCKRNSNPLQILNILAELEAHRPDLRWHGFGVKKTALEHPLIRRMFYSTDSMAWSFAARKDGRGPDANKWQEAKQYEEKILRLIG